MALEVEVETLKRIGLFRDVDPAKLRLVAFVADRLSYDPGEVIFRQGESADAVYVVLSGAVDITFQPAGADPVTLARLGDGALVGEMGVLSGKPRSATVTAVAPSELIRIGGDEFLSVIADVPQLGRAVMRELALRIETMNERLSAREPH